jgi:hypothetical protein
MMETMNVLIAPRLFSGLEESTNLALVSTSSTVTLEFVYYESRKRELQRRLINEGRCDERLKAKVDESTCLTYTGLHDKTN